MRKTMISFFHKSSFSFPSILTIHREYFPFPFFILYFYHLYSLSISIMSVRQILLEELSDALGGDVSEDVIKYFVFQALMSIL